MSSSGQKRKYPWPHSNSKLENERDRVYFQNIIRNSNRLQSCLHSENGNKQLSLR